MKKSNLSAVIRVYLCSSVAIFPFFLSACESDFVTDPTRPRPTRAVQSPYDNASGSGEAMAPPSDAVPFLVVQFPNTKEEQPVVRTIFDPGGAHLPGPAGTRPATQPADQGGQQATAAAVLPVHIVQQQKPEDRFALSPDSDGGFDLTVTSPSGIGSVILERTGDTWPALIHVTCRYTDQKPFAVLEGFNASEVVSDTQRLSLKSTLRKTEGRADIAIPAFVRGNRIAIDWTDVYR